ncbi:MAG TPA: hypothetical protein ENK52_02995 [Saprospiraceae bacterium]|nr:hypothetical protein [Saprospiraceae bacterium]
MNSATKKKIISAAAPFITALKVHQLFAPFYHGIGHILTFHRVLPLDNRQRIHNHLSLEISPIQLENTIHFFKERNYKFWSLDQLSRNIKKKDNPKFVVFTFDDGYYDNYDFAYPILKKHNIPFTIYITTNFPDRKAILWWYLLEDVLLEETSITFHWQEKNYFFPTKNQSEKESAFDQIRSLINQCQSISQQKELLELVLKDHYLKHKTYAKRLTMNWDEIKELSNDPLVTIGAHTVNHFSLTRLNELQLADEILKSKNIIELQIDRPVEHFAYPFGKSAEASIREFEFIKQANFKTATTTRMGNIFPQHQNYMECLPRLSINRASTNKVLQIQISGLLSCLVHKGKKIITH